MEEPTNIPTPMARNKPTSRRDRPAARAARSDPLTPALMQALQHAIAAYARHDWGEAERICRLVLSMKADCVDALNYLGMITAQTQRTNEARDLLGRAAALNPDNAYIHSNLGNVLKDLGRWNDALQSYGRAVRLKPDYAEAHYNRAVTLQELKRWEEALESYERAIHLKSDYADAYSNRGNVLKEINRFGEALTSYDTAIALNPDHAESHGNRGGVLHLLKRWDEALQSHDHAIRLRPEYAGAHFNRGVTLQELGRWDEALASYERAIRLNPEYAEAHGNRGNTLKELGRFDEALASYDRAVELKPDFAQAYSNRGNTLKALKRLNEALASHDRALRIEPDYAEGHWNRCLCHLLMGDFTHGWEGYEWRWRLEQRQKWKRDFKQPFWLGKESLSGRTILLHGEQGLGDTLQFCRYARLVNELGARVILEVQQSLVSLLARLDGVTHVVARGSALPEFDCHCPLLSLPLAFKTRLDTIPAEHNYISADDEKVSEWRAKLGERIKPRIGLVWSSSTPSDKSIALADIARALPDGFQYVSLQKEVRDVDAGVLASCPGMLHFAEQLNDFADTAALCALMDVVVSVDTSVAHLAGAMGKPLWILVTYVPDWRWLLDRNDSPWYPSARLFRQERTGDWAGVIDRVRTELLRALAAPA